MRRVFSTALGLALLPATLLAQDDVVRRLGKTVVQYKDEVVQVVVGFRHANQHLDKPWIAFQLHVSAAGNKPVTVHREDVALVLPNGTRMSLPSQKQMSEGIRDIRRMLQEISIASDPLEGYFISGNRVERIGFFAVPGEQITLDEFTVDRYRIGEGLLFFHAPDDAASFPPGRYKLEIFNKDVDVKLPFEVPAGDFVKKKGKDKGVTW